MDALESEINEVINETIQCLDAYHVLFSDVIFPSKEKKMIISNNKFLKKKKKKKNKIK